MKTFFHFLALALVVALCPLFSEAAVVPDTTFINPANGNTYFVLEEAPWTENQAEAVALGGNLATINDAAENQWLVDTFANLVAGPGGHNSANIGLNDIQVEGQYEWASGEPVTFTNWITGEPNNLNDEDWVEVQFFDGTTLQGDPSFGGQWNDNNLSQGGRRAIVEISIPEPSSFLLAGLVITTAAYRRR